MKEYLIIGLGSMGKRRIRCLLALGIAPGCIWGLEKQDERREEVEIKYGIHTVSNEEEIDFSSIEAVIVSLPPDKHFIGAQIAIDHNKPVFIEASVVLDDVCQIRDYNKGKVYIAPSCTLTYHPMIMKIGEIVKSEIYGKVCNFTYHCGQYLPDWHPWESVKNYYVGQRITGGAREIVPFEFTWLCSIVGFPSEVKGYYRKTMDVGCEIEDSYACAILYKEMVGSMIVDVVARYAVRNLILNMEKAQIQWSWDSNKIAIYEAENKDWIYYEQPELIHQEGYNENINENMYIEEIKGFLDGINNHDAYYNTLDKDIMVLELLKQIEDSDGGYERQFEG